jgi:GTPase SAR1 family protein
MILVGNKSDLEYERAVSETEGMNLSQQLRICYVETSAKNRSNVDKSFHDLIRVIRKSEKQSKVSEKKKGKKGCQIL